MTGTRRAVKARILATSLVDVLLDLLGPLLVYLALHAIGTPTYFALAAGGVLVGGKAALGRISQWRADRHAAFVLATCVLALAAMGVLAVAGVPDVLCVAAAGLLVGVPVLASGLARGRRIDGIGLLVLVELAVSVTVTLVSDDPRFVLARPAIYVAVAGCYALATVATNRPLMLDATKPIAAAGDPVRAAAFENAWRNSARFRGIERAMTAGIGAVALVGALCWVVVSYFSAGADLLDLGLDAQLPLIVLMVVFVLAVRFLAVPRVRAIVDGEMEKSSM